MFTLSKSSTCIRVVCLPPFDTASKPSWLFAQVLLSIPGDVAVTKEDVAADSACAQLASERSELVGLALWLVSQRCKVGTSCLLMPQLSSGLFTAQGSSLHAVVSKAVRTVACPSLQTSATGEAASHS